MLERLEGSLDVLTPEKLTILPEFNRYQKMELERNGKSIISLRGLELDHFSDKIHFSNLDPVEINRINKMTSLRGQVAIDLKYPYLPDSNGKFLSKQRTYVHQDSYLLNIIGTRAIMSDIATMVEIWSLVPGILRQNPFNPKTIRLLDPEGRMVGEGGLIMRAEGISQLAISSFAIDRCAPDVYACPVIVPVGI